MTTCRVCKEPYTGPYCSMTCYAARDAPPTLKERDAR